MCGRYVLSATTGELMDDYDIDEAWGPDVPPSWNIAPTQRVRIITEQPGEEGGADDAAAGPRLLRQLRTVRWGLVPHWAKDPSIGTRMINARSETVAVKPSFKAAAARRRCLVPADGYYEWSGTGRAKTPYFLHDPDGERLAMAGLYERWRDPAVADDDPERWLWTCTVITRAAPDALGAIHDRSPVVVPRRWQAEWLDCSSGRADDAAELLAEIPPPMLQPREVSRAVGNVRNNAPTLIEPVGGGAMF